MSPVKRQQRPIPTSKDKQTLHADKRTYAERDQPIEAEKESLEVEQLQKHPRRTAIDQHSVARTLDFDEPFDSHS